MKRKNTFVRTSAMCVVLAIGLTEPWTASEAQQRGLEATRNQAAVMPKIVGGESAVLEQIPWQVSLQAARDISIPGLGTIRAGSHFCGGSLIQDDDTASWILTASHCLIFFDLLGNEAKRLEPDDVVVISGTAKLNDSARLQQSVAEVITHDEYDPETSENDIALLQLEPLTAAQRNSPRAQSSRQVIELPTVQDVEALQPYTEVTVSGWGATFEGGAGTNDLMLVHVPVVDADTCRESYGLAGIDIVNTMLCAGFRSGGRDSCQGDSGGPLAASATKNPDDALLVGVVSFGIGCARNLFYGVYTRVPAYLNWIAGQIDAS